MPSEEEVRECIERLRREQEPSGYHLNPNQGELEVVVAGYLENQERFGYPACPCRLATGIFEEDKDIVCPCDYRDDDISEFGACYCSLYVDDDIFEGRKMTRPIPERRPPQEEHGRPRKRKPAAGSMAVSVNVWRCPVCGYLAAKEQPPPKCPICGASKERFELFIKSG